MNNDQVYAFVVSILLIAALAGWAAFAECLSRLRDTQKDLLACWDREKYFSGAAVRWRERWKKQRAACERGDCWQTR